LPTITTIQATRNAIVNIGLSQSLAVRSGKHSPLVFDDPARFRREGTDAEKRALGTMIETTAVESGARVPRGHGAQRRGELGLRPQASAAYRTPVDYWHRQRLRRRAAARRRVDRG
jgi:hypothetical protein